MSMNDEIAKEVASATKKLSDTLNDLQKSLSSKVTALENANSISSIRKLEKYMVSQMSITTRTTDNSWIRLPSIIVRIGVPEKFRKEVLNIEKESDLDFLFDSDEVQSHANLMAAELIVNQIQKYDNELKAVNLEIVAYNTKLKDTFFNIAKQLGLQTTGGRYKRSKYETYHLEWYRELSGMFETSHSAPYESSYRERKSSIASYYNKIKDAIAKIQLEDAGRAALAEKKRREDAKLQELIAKYIEEPGDYTWNDLLEDVLSQDQYLKVAHLMAETRNGGSYKAVYYAASGLPDPEIADAILKTCANWEGDGRIFRDCEYNHSVLFAIVAKQNKELYDDYETICSKVSFD